MKSGLGQDHLIKISVPVRDVNKKVIPFFKTFHASMIKLLTNHVGFWNISRIQFLFRAHLTNFMYLVNQTSVPLEWQFILHIWASTRQESYQIFIGKIHMPQTWLNSTVKMNPNEINNRITRSFIKVKIEVVAITMGNLESDYSDISFQSWQSQKV